MSAKDVTMRWTTAAALLVAAWVPGGCGPRDSSRRSPAEAPLETVDVAPARDASASLADEPVAARREPSAGFSGVLPAGFPDDVPLPSPASLIDSGWRGERIVEIVVATPASTAEVAAVYARQLAASGWRREGDGLPGRWSKGGRSLEVGLVDSRPGSRLRLAVAVGR